MISAELAQAYQKEYEDAYKQSNSGWQGFLSEAQRDMKFRLGDQWSNKDKAWLKKQRREAMVFNRTNRTISIISGYERKNRLSLKGAPYGLEDDKIAEIFTGLLMHSLSFHGGYHVMSEVFDRGTLTVGVGFIELYLDPHTGLLRYRRVPFNRCLWDPASAELDMSDCYYFIRRDYMTKAQIKRIVPNTDGEHAYIDELPMGKDEKFAKMPINRKRVSEDMMSYTEMYVRTSSLQLQTLDKRDGVVASWNGTRAARTKYLKTDEGKAYLPHESYVDKMELRQIVSGKVVWAGPDPLRINDFPFIPVYGYFVPECDDEKYKLQGVVRSLRDPQNQYNKRMSQMVDIIESTISTGWKAETESVIDERMLYQSGQGPVIWTGKGKFAMVERLTPPAIPESFFAISDRDERNIFEIAGVNEELMGSETTDIPGVLSKLRQGAALTILQPLFDNFRESKKILARKAMRVFQMNYSSAVVERVIHEKIDESFYEADILAYDIIPQEGILTDSQREMAYTELRALQEAGAPIPWSSLLDASPIQYKQKLRDDIAKGEKAQAEERQRMIENDEILKGLQLAQIAKDLGQAKERQTAAEENSTDAALNRVKTMEEVNKLRTENLAALADIGRGMEADPSRFEPQTDVRGRKGLSQIPRRARPRK